MRVDAFDFYLPSELIAQQPARPRDSARLLHVMPFACADLKISDLPSRLRAGDLVIFNDTKVLPARLVGYRDQRRISVTLHQPHSSDAWSALAKPARKCRLGDVIRFGDDLSAEVTEQRGGGEVVLAFDKSGDALMDAVRRHGEMPLPPYIRRPDKDLSDREDYQTIFARNEGAVAAPTASLHFTPALLAALAAMGIAHAFVTLHVGAGTFLPVKTTDTAGHHMHSERFELPEQTIAAIDLAKRSGGRVIAAGTTVLRTLETVVQERGRLHPGRGDTALFITPGYRFRVVDLLLTNFHLPRSTLFMLVAAFSGLARMQEAYAHAIEQRYRFYSYGDACLLEPGAAA